uniref:BACK domain-containing protein n=1 Tax=Ditylenchus dipsaci TaxID=166011 RepID=A0A915E901_9BILA
MSMISVANQPQQTTPKNLASTSVIPVMPQQSIGMDCFADDRDALNDFSKYFNNAHLSDVSLVVGDEAFPATEYAFLRFLYCNHVVLNSSNALPLLILSDKYNVNGLKKICIEYAINYILSELSLKEIFHIWFGYATKAYHLPLIHSCIEILSKQFQEIVTSAEWEKDWLAVDRDQLLEFLKCNQLVISNEFAVWEAVQKWLKATAHPERRGNTSLPLLVQILPLVRFPFMSADELSLVESSPTAIQHSKAFMAHTHLAYKFISMPLSSRSANFKYGFWLNQRICLPLDMAGDCLECRIHRHQFLARNYTDVRWDKRFTVTNEQLYERNQDHIFNFTTKSSIISLPHWDWLLNFHVGLTPATGEELRIVLTGLDIDHSGRSIEYLLMITTEVRVLKMISGTKLFSKARYSAELELQNKLEVNDILAENAPLLANGICIFN